MHDKKARLIKMVKKGGALEGSKEDRRERLGRLLCFERETLVVKESTLENLQNSQTAYTALIHNLESGVKRNISEIWNLLTQAKKNVGGLRNASNKKEMVNLAISIGFNKAHVEILKNDNNALRIQISEYERMISSLKPEIRSVETEIKILQESIAKKEKVLEENEPSE